MDKKKPFKVNLPPEDLRGFEEFIEGQGGDTSFMKRQGNEKKDAASFEHFTFLTNDAERLNRIKDLLMEQLPFATKFEQGEHIISEQRKEIALLKKGLFDVCNKPGSLYRKSIGEMVDAFFEPPKS